MVNGALSRYLERLELLCQDLWVLTPHPLCLHFLLHFWVLNIFNFLEKGVGPGLQGLYVTTPVGICGFG